MPQSNHRDKKVAFSYQGKTCSGHILTSTDREPHYYWFFFDSREFIEKISDSIAFTDKEGSLVPVHNYTRHLDLVRIVKSMIERFLKGDL